MSVMLGTICALGGEVGGEEGLLRPWTIRTLPATVGREGMSSSESESFWGEEDAVAYGDEPDEDGTRAAGDSASVQAVAKAPG